MELILIDRLQGTYLRSTGSRLGRYADSDTYGVTEGAKLYLLRLFRRAVGEITRAGNAG